MILSLGLSINCWNLLIVMLLQSWTMQSKILTLFKPIKVNNKFSFRVYANHSKKKGIDLEDVKLASTMLLDKSFTGPPPREVLLEVAKQKNTQPLPLIKPHSGIRLPPDRHCLLAANYKLRAATSQAPTKKLVKSALGDGMSTIKTKLSNSGGSSPSATTIKKPTLGQTVNKGQSIVSMPKPVFKVTKTIVKQPRALPTSTASSNSNSGMVTIKMDTDQEAFGLKRKRSEEVDFEVLA